MDEIRLLIARPDWWDDAACLGVGPQYFFQDETNRVSPKKVKSFCDSCTVKPQCKSEGERSFGGYWAGERNPREITKPLIKPIDLGMKE